MAETDLDALAAVAPTDKVTAAAQWRADAPPLAANLLDAMEVE